MEKLLITDLIKNLIISKNHGLNFSPEYSSRKLSNHFPMTLYALCQLGGTQQNIKDLYKHQRSFLEKPHPVGDIDINQGNFSEYLGSRKAYLGYYKFFSNNISDKNPLPKINELISGLGAGAFHAIIRIAYGLEANLKCEIAAGLAYLADAYQITINYDKMKNGTSPLTYTDFYLNVLENHINDRIGLPELKGVIFEKLRIISLNEKTKKILNHGCYSQNLKLVDIAKCNLDLFLRTNNFTALHTVTLVHASRIIEPFLTENKKFLSILAANSLAALLTIPIEQFHEPYKLQKECNKIDIIKAVKGQIDDHALKIAYTCIEEYKYYDDIGYLAAALHWIERK